MDKSSEKETHDYFMNVDSFSQLPFIRSVPAKNKAIKLFGIEFGVDEKDTDKHPINSNQEIKERDNNGESSSSSSNRRFECHYCRRNFPTSQALGGHQNAHKRERQHAKRAHLLPAMVGSSSSLSDHCGVYGNQSMSSYPTWNTISNSSTRFFDGHVLSFMQQPISGSSLALWRIPTVHSVVSAVNRNRRPSLLQPLPLFAGDGGMKPSLQVDHGSGLSQGRLGFEPQPSMQDHVSLDLHL